MIKSKKNKNRCSQRYNVTCHPVEKIIGFYTGKEKRRYYRVQWAPSWVPEENLLGCEKLIEQFFVEENIINKDKTDLNASKITKIKLKLEEEDYACWGCEPKPTSVGDTVQVHDESPDSEKQRKEPLKIKCEGVGEEWEKTNKDHASDDHIVENIDDVETGPKSIQSTPSKTPIKPATRAMMATNSPSVVKSVLQSPLREEKRTKVEEEVVSSIDARHVGKQKEDKRHVGKQTEDESSRKYHTRLYYKELRTHLRNARSKKMHAPRSDASNSKCKVYNTRLRAREQTTSRTRSGIGVKYVTQCVKKLPYGISSGNTRKSLSPRQRDIKIEKTDDVGDGIDSIKNENIEGGKDYIDYSSTPRLRGKPLDRKSQNNVNIKKEFSKYNGVIKQEPVSPEYVRFVPPSVQAGCSRERCVPRADEDNMKNMNNMKEELTQYERYNSFFQKLNDEKNESLLHNGSAPMLKDYCLRGDGKSRANISNSSSEDSEEGCAETPFECDVCEKMFQTSVLLHRHRFIHCENRPFSFNKRRPNTRLQRENKENYDVRKFKAENDDSSSSLKVYSHHLRPRREGRDVR